MRQLVNCFPQFILTRYSAEIQLLLDFLFFRFTISTEEAITPGNTLQNLNFKFTKPQRQKALLMILTVFLPYLTTKLSDMISRNNWSDRRNWRAGAPLKDRLKYVFAKLLTILNNLFKVASLVNLLLFFVTHSKRSVPERLLGINL